MVEWFETVFQAIQSNPIVAGIFGTTVIAGLGLYLKSIPKTIVIFLFNLLTIRIIFDQQSKMGNSDPYLDLLSNNSYFFMWNRLSRVKKFTFSRTDDVVSSKKNLLFIGSMGETYWTVLYGVLCSFSVSQSDNQKNRIFILSIRFYTFNSKKVKSIINRIIKEEKSLFNQEEINHYYYNDGRGWEESHRQYQFSQSPYMLTSKQEEIYAKVAHFLNNEERYLRFGKSYHTGILLYGDPGCGKSQFIKKLAEDFGLPIYVLNLACTLSDYALISLIGSIRDSRAIVLMEDIDRFSFTGEVRQNISKMEEGVSDPFTIEDEDDRAPQFLSFSTILNILDGIYAPDNGLIFIATTNHFEKLDTAFIRPGRFDYHYRFSPMTHKEICNFISLQYNSKASVPLNSGITLPIAVVANACFENQNIDDCVTQLNTTIELES